MLQLRLEADNQRKRIEHYQRALARIRAATGAHGVQRTRRGGRARVRGAVMPCGVAAAGITDVTQLQAKFSTRDSALESLREQQTIYEARREWARCFNCAGGVTREFLLHVQERLRKLREEKRRLQAELDSLQFGDNHVTSRHIRQVGRAVFVWGGCGVG